MKKFLIVVAALFVVLVACTAMVQAVTTPTGDSSTSSNLSPEQNRFTDDPDPTETAAPKGIGEGVWEVGADIKPGKYKTSGPVEGGYGLCYWERQKDLDGGFESILANDNLQGPGVVVIKRSDAAFKTNGCATWVRQK